MSELRALVRFAQDHRVVSLFDLDPAPADHYSRFAGILREISAKLRIVYFMPAETKEAGYIETEHFGVRFHRCRSDLVLDSAFRGYMCWWRGSSGARGRVLDGGVTGT
ncbi:hypothetical protein ACFWDI_40890, partial [Streptomyces sp. NPDC060064]|uniref:hypothetical protein n=1 Tax=Streptomyces sp. NPDC060064 TaxID=3347049 RepID=UPI0036CE2DF6